MIVLLVLLGLVFAQDHKEFIRGMEENLLKYDAGKLKEELEKKAGIRAQEDASKVQSKESEGWILDLIKNSQSQPVQEFKCYEVREVKVKGGWRCSLDGRVYEDEGLCRANCFAQRECLQSPCFTSLWCEKLSGGWLCPIGKTACNYYCDGGTLRGGECVTSPSEETVYVTCSSFGYSYSECPTSFDEIKSISVNKKFSKSACVYNYSYGIKGTNLWVDHGCRAEFKVVGVSCPSGFSYEGGECTKEAVATCPAGPYPCVEERPGVSWCSPYSCFSVGGSYACATGPISGLNSNSVGLWWCSGDGSWFLSEEECRRGCPYYLCSHDGKSYAGYDNCLKECREVGSCSGF